MSGTTARSAFWVRSNTEDWLPLVRVLAVDLHDFMESGCSDAVFSAVRPFEPRHFELDEYEVFQFPESPAS